jgi:hypothetical protein
MTNKAIFTACVLCLLFLNAGCVRRKQFHAPVDKKGSPTITLEFVDLADSYALGSQIILRMRLIIDSKEPVEFVFPSSCPAEFVIYRDGEPIWNSLEGMACLQVITKTTFNPSDTLEYSSQWNCTTKSWKGVTLGKYTVQGLLLSNPPVKTEAKTIHLVD